MKIPLSTPSISTPVADVRSAEVESAPTAIHREVDILVAGSLASDTMCDYLPYTDVNTISPILHTSNPGQITQSAGGVGRNVATAAHYAGARVALASAVADDIAGFSLLDRIKRSGLDASHIAQLKTSDGARTAQYVAVNDKNKDLVVAVADMDIFTRPELTDKHRWSTAIESAKPKWMVVDGNWSAPIMSTIIEVAKSHKIPIALEPVSTAKAARIFDTANKAINSTSVVPNHSINLITPNVLELSAMHAAAQKSALLESDYWWQVIDSFNLSSSGSRDKFTIMTSAELTDAGVPQQSIQLLPYIPNIITKLGSQGVLLTSLLKPGDDRLRTPEHIQYILSRSDADEGIVGGVYMRLFPPAAQVPQEDIVSVNGVGDTLLGVLMAGVVKAPPGKARLEELIPLAQDAAVLTLKSKEAVSQSIMDLR